MRPSFLSLSCASLSSTLLASLALSLLSPHDARACGGCFHGEPPPGEKETASVVTDHRMVLSIGTVVTTLWDQVEYSGDPANFAWVLPIRGEVVVGVGSDAFIDALDVQTAPQIDSPTPYCPRPAAGCGGGAGSSAAGCGASAAGDDVSVGYQEDAGIYVTGRSTAGPYAAVQVHGDDEKAIVGWLRDHHYVVPPAIEPILARYVSEGFDFVAVRLTTGAGTSAMQPIRISWRGPVTTLPLRMVAAGVGASVGLKLFVVGDGRWKPKNFPTFVVDPSTLSWDFAQQRSNYVARRQELADAWHGRAFALEASLDLPFGALPFTTPPAALDAGPTAADSGGADAREVADAGDAAAASDASDASEASASDTTPRPTYDAGMPPTIDPSTADVTLAFQGSRTRRVTRLRADLPAQYLDGDLELEADEYQTQLPRTVQVQRSTNMDVVCRASSAQASSGRGGNRGCVVGEGRGNSVDATLAGLLAALGAMAVRRARRR